MSTSAAKTGVEGYSREFVFFLGGGGGVPLGNLNPDPVSDQKMLFSTPVIRSGFLNPSPFSGLVKVEIKLSFLD